MDFNFKTGDIIEFSKEQFEVIENNGFRGVVREYFGEGNYGSVIDRFYWSFEGEDCKLVRAAQPTT